MKFFKADGMQRVDQETIRSGISGEELMGRASWKLADELYFFSEGHPRRVVILCGPGNNGGDGCGLALHLQRMGWPVEIWLCCEEDRIKGDAHVFYERAKSEEIRIQPLLQEADWQQAGGRLSPGTWLVDALLGTGSKYAPRGNIASAVSFLSQEQSRHTVWAVDIPSGLHPDKGAPFDETCCVKADHTLTLGGAKSGCQQDESVTWTGSLSVLDLGFPELILQAHADPESASTFSDLEARNALPAFSTSSHKGNRGHLLLIGGSLGMTGAISLSAWAALRAGCGLVTVLTPFSCAPLVDAAVPEAMVIHGKQGKFMSLSNQEIDFSRFKAVGMGPGLRLNFDSSELLSRTLKECPVPLVLDADALNAFALLDREHQKTRTARWLTPHPGEMARLLNCPVQQTQQEREWAVQESAKRFEAYSLLKGSRSRVADLEGGTWVNLNGNEGMATAGCGDVLTGLLSSFLAQGVDHNKALPLAVYVHGRAGDLAAIRKGKSGMLAGDVVDAIPAVLKHLQGR